MSNTSHMKNWIVVANGAWWDPRAPASEGRVNENQFILMLKLRMWLMQQGQSLMTINNKLWIRNMVVTIAMLCEWQQQHMKLAWMSIEIWRLHMALCHGQKNESSKAFMSLHNAVPFILHLEIWVGLKFFMMLFCAGLSNTISGVKICIRCLPGSTQQSQWVLCLLGSTGYLAYDRQYQ